MKNPWEDITLNDYENHMKLDSVMQLQALNEMMKDQFQAYDISTLMILGIAGGNGLEHIRKDKFKRIYGIDINADYLKEARKRYPELDEQLDCLCIDLTKEYEKLPNADMIVADLLIEYIGYDCFQKIIKHVHPKYVSCIIQINMEDHWVSDSPYLHVFDQLEKIHFQMDEQTLKDVMRSMNYHMVNTRERILPNGKKLIQLDFEK